jgi:hypothetical protein
MKPIWETIKSKPEDLERVRNILQKGPTKQTELICAARISKTRVLCALSELIKSGGVIKTTSGYIQKKKNEDFAS